MTTKDKPTVENLPSALRRLNLSPLENRLIGKPLVELEHCLVEVLGILEMEQRSYQRSANSAAKGCIEAVDRDTFFDLYREYSSLNSYFSGDYNPASPAGLFFDELLKKLVKKEKKEFVGTGDLFIDQPATVTHARILAQLVTLKIEQMWKAVESRDEKVHQVWMHWMEK